MDAQAACIICNWANNVLWPYFGLGALGAGAAAAAAAGFFGGGGFSGAGGGLGQDDSGADQTQSQSEYDDSTIRHPGPGESWPETGRNTRDAWFRQQRDESPWVDINRASADAMDWVRETFGPEEPAPFVVSGTSRNNSHPQ